MKTITKEQLIDKILTDIEENKRDNTLQYARELNSTLYLALSNLIKE